MVSLDTNLCCVLACVFISSCTKSLNQAVETSGSDSAGWLSDVPAGSSARDA